jgi:hypothetical protein
MPNYTKNTLIVKGPKDALTYFYERNRVTENDVKYIGGVVSDLSFGKCVTRENDTVIIEHIKQNYNSKHNNTGWDGWDLTCSIWGTKWEAIDPSVDLSEIDLGKITYKFDTAWSYPHNWIITISKIFYTLEFDIIFTNEDDEYDMTYVHHFKQGKYNEVESYSRLKKTVETHGRINIVNKVIEYLNKNDVKIHNYITEKSDKNKKCEEIDWKEFCKLHIMKYGNEKDYESHLMAEMGDYLSEFYRENKIYSGVYMDKELSKLFVEKVKELI